MQERLTRVTERAIQSELKAIAISQGLSDPDLLGLISRMPGAPEVKFDDSGELVGAAEAVAKFKEWKPDFFRGVAPAPTTAPVSTPRTTGNPTPAPSTGPVLVDIKSMNKQQYAEWKRKELGKLRG